MPYTYVLSFSDLSSDTFNLSYSEYLTGSSMMMIFSHQTYMIFPTTYTFMIFCKTYRSLQFPDVCFNQFSIAKISGSSKVTAGTRFLSTSISHQYCRRSNLLAIRRVRSIGRASLSNLPTMKVGV